ncbi:rhomboid family intramembrane serine protease [Sediminispirochaeta smaragdinae]|jgi:membrane associated rhomboid family serine protease|uniref:Rhomboid family protein n=1 Tax=Sediminispirochaeta smaragdinae (strain DSM 11293 / JCM 15392 / SEBR 4228) TaxID=573413 RepID=E1RAG3_SEDSS|nr:rhomboid family intramembrane serine protease [Sediminispirochaeta smaragdinae]ADK79454.1 Rhomboid family protein [Sediminispirochaeta smaragdinae DSM 11293]
MDNRSIIRRPFRYRYYNAAFGIIIVNIVFFVFNTISPQSRYYTALIPGLIIGKGFYWQFFTYMFTHANISHIFFNMLGLFFFGTQVERRIGSSEFLLFYLLTGFLAGLFSFIVYTLTGMYGAVLLGASGAIFAVLLAFAVYFPYANIYIMGIIPVKAPLLVIGYTAIELFSQLLSINSGVAHLTHLAGFVFAFFYFLIRLNINPIEVFRGGRRR